MKQNTIPTPQGIATVMNILRKIDITPGKINCSHASDPENEEEILCFYDPETDSSVSVYISNNMRQNHFLRQAKALIAGGSLS